MAAFTALSRPRNYIPPCYDAGKSNVRTYLFRDYTSELAQAHGVRAAYPSFGIEYIQNVLQANINSVFLALA